MYVITKDWRFRAVTLAQYSQSQSCSRRRRRHQRQQQSEEAAASRKLAAGVAECAPHKAAVAPGDSSADSSVHNCGDAAGAAVAAGAAGAAEPGATAAALRSQRHVDNLEAPVQPESSRIGQYEKVECPPNSRDPIIIPHPGGPGGRCEIDSSRSLAASSDAGGKMAVVIPEAARFAAMKSASLRQQLVRGRSRQQSNRDSSLRTTPLSNQLLLRHVPCTLPVSAAISWCDVQASFMHCSTTCIDQSAAMRCRYRLSALA